MERVRSIRVRLSLVFVFLLTLVIVLGLEGLRSLRSVDDASAQIRDRWLPSTRALGDLNNLTTDFPAAQAMILRARSAGERATSLQQLVDLDRGTDAAQLAYQEIQHDATENELYARFQSKWRDYRGIVERSKSLPSGDAGAAPGTLLEQASKSSYATASELLSMLTDRTIASAREASQRSDLAYSEARRQIAFTMLLAGLLVAGAMLYVTRSISAPLIDLAARMRRLAANETSVEVIGTCRYDEIGEMARAVVIFRNNAIDLASNRHTLAQQAAALQDKLAAEQRLTQLQRNFVSMASHEFRTPLAIIDGHTQRLISMRDRLTTGELTERARKIRSMVRRLTQLIDNLIGSARLIDGPMELHYHPSQIDLTKLVHESCHLQRELTPEAQILEPEEARQLLVYGDASLLSQLFSNLLSNAVKYSPNGGLIAVHASLDGEQIAVVIEDHGIGIPESDRHRIFERYYRGSNTSGIAGSGVGLSLVSTIIELHKGSIELDSREFEGTRFVVRLPVVAAAPASARMNPVAETSLAFLGSAIERSPNEKPQCEPAIT
jgi:two-component system, OmpR family, sensor kinase